MNEKPYISIVATSRNDRHGGNIHKRMFFFIKGLIHQSNKFRLPVELIIVEWNPLPGQPLLNEVLPKPAPTDFLTLRYIIVPGEIHQRYLRSKNIPLYQMIAKNVGVRRAKGEFILCTNVDVIFSDELFSSLARKNLSKDFFYRANRCDIPDKVEIEINFENLLQYAKRNVIRRLGKNSKYLSVIDKLFISNIPFLKWIAEQWLFLLSKVAHEPVEKVFRQLDTNACGDFTMMHKDAWSKIQGYLELDLYSIHIDSLALIAASSIGIKQYIFAPKECLYHIDHPTGWESMSSIEKMKFSQERPGLNIDILQEAADYMLNNRVEINLNGPNWGLADENLEEIVFN